MAKITIERKKEYFNALRKYNIYVNNKNIGSIRNGESKTFQIPDNAEEIYAKIDWCRSNKLKITEQDNNIKVSAFKYNLAFLIISIVLLASYHIVNQFTDSDFGLFIIWPIPLILIYIFTFGKNKYLVLIPDKKVI